MTVLVCFRGDCATKVRRDTSTGAWVAGQPVWAVDLEGAQWIPVVAADGALAGYLCPGHSTREGIIDFYAGQRAEIDTESVGR